MCIRDRPNVPENYVHRIGRTARAGASGIAIAFCSMTEMKDFLAIERKIKLNIEVAGGVRWEKVPDENIRRKSRGRRNKNFNKEMINGVDAKDFSRNGPNSKDGESLQFKRKKKKRRSGVRIKKKAS